MKAAMPPLFWAEAAPGIAADADGQVDGQGTGRDDFQVHLVGNVSQAHDGTFAKILFNLAHCIFKCCLFCVQLHSS